MEANTKRGAAASAGALTGSFIVLFGLPGGSSALHVAIACLGPKVSSRGAYDWKVLLAFDLRTGDVVLADGFRFSYERLTVEERETVGEVRLFDSFVEAYAHATASLWEGSSLTIPQLNGFADYGLAVSLGSHSPGCPQVLLAEPGTDA